MRRNSRFGYIVLILLASSILLFFFFDRIAIYIFAKGNGLNISYKEIERRSTGAFVFKGLSVSEEKSGRGLAADTADIKLGKVTKKLLGGPVRVRFDMHGVRFITQAKAGTGTAAYDSLTGLVAVPFDGKWSYDSISGTVERYPDKLLIKDLLANGKEIRLKISGDIYYNINSVKLDITAYFSEPVLAKLPRELSGPLLNDESDGWKSFSVHLSGDLTTPSVSVTGKLFRLNIREIEEAN